MSSLLTLFSCASKIDERIELLELELNIDLPPDYTITQDDDEILEFIPSEYRLTLTLEFAPNGFDELIRGLYGVPYFDQFSAYSMPTRFSNYTTV